MKKINIAIDGPSGSGKSTVAKALAKKLNYLFINTGLMYRSYAYKVLLNKINLKDKKNFTTNVLSLWVDNMITLDKEGNAYLDGVNVTQYLQDDLIASLASSIAKIVKVREYLTKQQREYALDKGVVMDGRDITFNVLPDAELKIFLDANVEERARRRFTEYEDIKENIEMPSYEEVLNELIERDTADMTRKDFPLHKTEDAIVVDSSNMSIEEVIDEIYKLAAIKIGSNV